MKKINIKIRDTNNGEDNTIDDKIRYKITKSNHINIKYY